MQQYRKLFTWGGIVLLVLGIGGLAVWMRSSKKVEIPTEPQIPLVRLVEIQAGDELEQKSFPGFVKESSTAKLAFRVPGPMSELNATIGKRVTAGTVLAKLDPRDFELAVQRASAGLAEAEAAFKAMRTGARAEDVAALEAKVRASNSQLDTAKLQWERMDKLFREETAPKVQYDVAKTQYDQALAQSEAAHKELEKAKTGSRPEEIEAMEAKIAGIRVQLATAQNALADSELRAPFDGYVSQKYVEKHEMIAAGTPVLAFTDTSGLEVASSLPEEMVLRQSRFQKFFCTFEAYPGQRFEAHLKELGQALQSGKQAYPIVVTLVPPEDISLQPGMSGNLVIELSRSSTPNRIPASAIIASADGKTSFVYLIDDQQTVHQHPVKIVRMLDDGVEIESDLAVGCRIVEAGAKYLSDGRKVRVETKTP